MVCGGVGVIGRGGCVDMWCLCRWIHMCSGCVVFAVWGVGICTQAVAFDNSLKGPCAREDVSFLTHRHSLSPSQDLGSFITLGTRAPGGRTPHCGHMDRVVNGKSVTLLKENPAGCPLQCLGDVDRVGG